MINKDIEKNIENIKFRIKYSGLRPEIVVDKEGVEAIISELKKKDKDFFDLQTEYIELRKKLEKKDEIICEAKKCLKNITKQPIRDNRGYYLGNYYILEPHEFETINDILKGNYNDE